MCKTSRCNGTREKDNDLEKCKLKNRNFKRHESKDGVYLRIRCDSCETGKYGKRKSPGKIKVDEHSERRRGKNRARPMES